MMKSFLLLGALAAAAVNMNAQTTLLNETFTIAADDQSLPAGWSSPDTDQKWYTSMTNANDLTLSMGFSGQVAVSFLDSSNPADLLISPAISLPSGGASVLSFKIGTFTGGSMSPGNAHYAVYALPSTSTFTGTETPILEETTATDDTALAKTISLTAYQGQNIKLYFRHFNSTAVIVLLDDVKVMAPTVLGTAETLTKEQVGIYPNPATESLTVKSKSDVISTEIYDLSGRKLDNQQGKNVNVRNLKPGNYILNVNTKEGKTSTKFIKK
ncbi:T9SS-dependent choice-of-anchor J family protein [Chryseobacterium daeguense]|uniref:T9SS-dependent choice-of-anchor J family protein n=1 Tax=Chryseobacterium daeguense TaxID=412438 RepID=UPI000406863C|nr:choice-of-anchor J domain-containing protein [Chryseobacterium daeguense]